MANEMQDGLAPAGPHPQPSTLQPSYVVGRSFDRELDEQFARDVKVELAFPAGVSSHDQNLLDKARLCWNSCLGRMNLDFQGHRVFWTVFKKMHLNEEEREATEKRKLWNSKKVLYHDCPQMLRLIDLAFDHQNTANGVGRRSLDNPDRARIPYSGQSNVARQISFFEPIAYRPIDQSTDITECWYDHDVISDILQLSEFSQAFVTGRQLIVPRKSLSLLRYSDYDAGVATDMLNFACQIINHFGWPTAENPLPILREWWTDGRHDDIPPQWDDTNDLHDDLLSLELELDDRPVVTIYPSKHHWVTALIDPRSATIKTWNSWSDTSPNGRRAIGINGINLVTVFARLLALFPRSEGSEWPQAHLWRHEEVDEVTRQVDAYSCGALAVDNAITLMRGHVPHRAYPDRHEFALQAYSLALRSAHLDALCNSLDFDYRPPEDKPALPHMPHVTEDEFVQSYHQQVVDEAVEWYRDAADPTHALQKVQDEEPAQEQQQYGFGREDNDYEEAEFDEEAESDEEDEFDEEAEFDEWCGSDEEAVFDVQAELDGE